MLRKDILFPRMRSMRKESEVRLRDVDESTQIAKKVAISLSIGCPRKHIRENRLENHCRKVCIGKLFMNYLTDKISPMAVTTPRDLTHLVQVHEPKTRNKGEVWHFLLIKVAFENPVFDNDHDPRPPTHPLGLESTRMDLSVVVTNPSLSSGS
ncbi:hypothetical protein AVEN_211128-1 [Araneus ventricosus]|uniref:Uncharacterized protein n=1 Tax=Araneus ventricosus TaxID=182803 RepID=A0A4Y2MV00_ARAVE|nr:hypothetical protein AVEN_211128-1 [Araneus ventricosus]